MNRTTFNESEMKRRLQARRNEQMSETIDVWHVAVDQPVPRHKTPVYMTKPDWKTLDVLRDYFDVVEVREGKPVMKRDALHVTAEEPEAEQPVWRIHYWLDGKATGDDQLRIELYTGSRRGWVMDIERIYAYVQHPTKPTEAEARQMLREITGADVPEPEDPVDWWRKYQSNRLLKPSRSGREGGAYFLLQQGGDYAGIGKGTRAEVEAALADVAAYAKNRLSGEGE